MTLKGMAAFAAVIVVTGAFAMAAEAAQRAAPAKGTATETGLDAMHAKVKIGGKVCYAEHTHYGSSTSTHRSKKLAELDAARAWSSFVDLEYGSAWASWSKAWAKKGKCQLMASGWQCDLEGRPCK